VQTDRIFLTAQWRHLAMLNYVVDPHLLQPLVPSGTELDFFADRAYVSLVGFRFLDTKVFGIPIPFHRDFDEVNLRFYVRRNTGSELRRGVVFIREIVPKRAIAAIARWVYNENYVAVPMRHQIAPERVSYEWGDDCRMELRPEGELCLPASGSEEQFIAEHYWGYTAQRDGGSIEYKVAHEAWRLRRAASARFEGDAASLYGKEFAQILTRQPDSALLAEGSPIQVMRGARIASTGRLATAEEVGGLR
jgi:uncharacterized protein YqjF (DUF2071 family)